ncbi:MAG: hypothetical protein K2W96_00470 [Gemmataceae bacterium]|nr:hypothetical protein [Gemmataceae bacterium]
MPHLLLVLALLAQPSPAAKAWQAGQEAMEADRLDEAVGQFQLCLRLDPTFAQAHLSLAAAQLALEQGPQAAASMERYLAAKPEHFPIRWHLSGLLLKLARFAEARKQCELFLRGAQMQDAASPEDLIRCHTRLMELAERRGDEYEERLNRGIGLYLLARRRQAIDGRSTEELLCKAAAELTLARMQRPDEARPSWYLHGVWGGLAQRHPAMCCLWKARDLAAPGALTPAERRDLMQAAALAAQEGRTR